MNIFLAVASRVQEILYVLNNFQDFLKHEVIQNFDAASDWTDDNGSKWDHPTLTFRMRQGFASPMRVVNLETRSE